MTRLLTAVLAVALASATSCAKRIDSPAQRLEEAASRAEKGSADARTLALAGFHAWLIAADPARAQEQLDAALRADANEPYALAGQVLLARRRARPDRMLTAALELCERAPRHPLSVFAARQVNELTGISPELDDRIVRQAEVALGKGLRGDAAQLLRSAVANVHTLRADAPAQASMLGEMGIATELALAGPLAAFDFLDFDTATPPERDGNLTGPLATPFGPISPRSLKFPDGRVELSGEGRYGDVYLLGVDVEVARPATHVVRTVTFAPHKVYLDGALLYEQRTFVRTSSSVSARAVELPAGKHRVLVKLIRDEGAGSISLSLMRSDGRPAELRLSAASGAAPGWSAKVRDARVEGVYPGAEDFYRALVDEAGPALAAYLAVRDGLVRDRDRAKPLLEKLATYPTPAVQVLRSELALGDRTIPTKVGRGRATRDLEAASSKDPGELHALLIRSNLNLDDGRSLEALELVKQARGEQKAPPYPVAMLQARVELALGLDAQADASAQEVERALPNHCEAVALRYDLARRRDAVALSEQLINKLQPCPGALARLAEHLKVRGDLRRAEETYRLLAEREPDQLSSVYSLAGLLSSQRRHLDAAEALRQASRRWPRNDELIERIGDALMLAGKRDEALVEWERALALDGGDLPLRRRVDRERTGKDPLEEYAVSGKEAIAAYEQQRGREDAQAAFILDAGAVRAYPDGSQIDRIHIIQKVLDQSGVQDTAEVNVPQGAIVLAMRTIKADGTVLEPENIEGKDSISLPGVQVGDYVEYEYLLGHSSRGPTLPGFTASSFYFQIARQPNNWATYTVAAPKGSGLKVDAHNLKVEPPKVEGELEVFRHQERRVPPLIPEPDSPPSGNEYLPFVTVGAGVEGQDALVAVYSDGYLDRGRLTWEVEQFAQQAAAGKKGLEAVKAIHAAVMEKIPGRDAGLGTPASHTLGQERGSRLWLLKASLEAAGFPTRIAVIRTFAVDPAPYLFPNEGLLPYVALRVQLPDGPPVWLDPVIRYGPFGVLPEHAEGERETWLMPEPGRPLEKVKSPPASQQPPKRVELSLTLSEAGALTGRGSETYSGMEAAQLAEALDNLSPDQRNQALQSALSRYFGGVQLTQLELKLERKVGAPLTVSYEFTSPRFARVEQPNRLALPPLTFPAQLGRRYVQLGARRTPLYLESSERSLTQVELTLPPGFTLVSPMAQVRTTNAFGDFVRKESQQGAVVKVEEHYQLQLGRIPPEGYDDFARFAGEVDLLQARDVVIEKR